MAETKKWLELCLTKLKLLKAILGSEYSTEAIKKGLNQRTTIHTEDFNDIMVLAHPNIEDCNYGSTDGSKCDFFKVMKEGKMAIKEIKYEVPPSDDNDGKNTIELFSKTKPVDTKAKYSCYECFFKHRITSLLERILCVSIEAKIEVNLNENPQSRNFAFVGIRAQIDGKKTTDNLLALKCKKSSSQFSAEEKAVKERNESNKKDNIKKNADAKKEGKRQIEFIPEEVFEEDVFIVSSQLESLAFLKVVPNGLNWQIDQKLEPLNSLRYGLPEIDLIEIKNVVFVDDSNTFLPLNTQFAKGIKTAFDIMYSKDSDFTNVMPIIKKLTKTIKKKKIEVEVGQSAWEKFKRSSLVESIKTSMALKVALCVILTFTMIFIIREVARPKIKGYKPVAIL